MSASPVVSAARTAASAAATRRLRAPGRTAAVAGLARLLAAAVVLAAGTAAVSLTLLGLLPFVLGWSSTVVLTGSMAPQIAPGDVVVLAPVAPARLQPGHVIRFQDPARPRRFLLHRIETVRPGGTLTTRGDANPAADTTPVPAAAVTGLARLRIPYAGLPSLWWQQRDYPRLGLLGAGLFLTARTLAGLPGLLHPGVVAGLHRAPGPPRLPRRSSAPAAHARARGGALARS